MVWCLEQDNFTEKVRIGQKTQCDCWSKSQPHCRNHIINMPVQQRESRRSSLNNFSHVGYEALTVFRNDSNFFMLNQ